MLWEAYEALVKAYDALEAANMGYVKFTDKATIKQEGDYVGELRPA